MDGIKQVLQVVGFINSAEGFMQQPAVLNGFTDLLVELWGDPGGETREGLSARPPPKLDRRRGLDGCGDQRLSGNPI
ncbi:MAG: hypothetical protein JSV18_03170 [Candidatus Bathyarchaeota archaeon]|nr:MAG: hypothetical protein JSV18_03170 [Candidatus Bathyarchaeota archaeon]